MTRGRRRVARPLAAVGSMLLIGALVGRPQAVGGSTTSAPSARGVADDAVTVTVTANAVGFLPRSLQVYSSDDTLQTACMGAATCSLSVPLDTPMVVKVAAPVPFSIECPAGSNTDGPGLIDGLWYGWCGSAGASPITASADVTVTATATGVVPSRAYIDTLPTWTASTQIGFEWDGSDGNWPVASFDVRFKRAAWNGSFGSWTAWKTGTADEWGTFKGSPGHTYCFSVRTNESNGGHSAWTAASCTAIPLDDRSLARSAHWAAGTGGAYFRSTCLRSKTSGATLTRTHVAARRIALVATTCSSCGKLKVYWGSKLLKTISLVSGTTVNQKVIHVATFSSVRTGTVRIVQASSGRRVVVDGLGIRRN